MELTQKMKAPELLAESGMRSKEADIYALGMVREHLYTMISLKNI